MVASTASFPSPIDPLTIWVVGGRLAAVAFDGTAVSMDRWIGKAHGVSETAFAPDPSGWVTRFARYFEGDMAAFDGGALAMVGTGFQRAVWEALVAVAPGATVSYGEFARRLGKAGAVRAVGAANGANPLPIVVPCHRVVAADGSLHGYGGGLHRKRFLLDHEENHAGAQKRLGLS
jgi:methylated-DNA-[protein]-cysteine S-methyltransferase